MISVIGGTYREIDYDDISFEILGSGFRATKFLLENNCPVNFITSGNNETKIFLKENQKVYKNFSFKCQDFTELITFKYCFAIDQPIIYPNVLNIPKTQELEVNDSNIVAYGMLESNFKINGKKVVYDPQTSINPAKFIDIGVADELIYIVNMYEAKSLASSNDLNAIKNYFFEVENCKALIIKNGPHGATLYLKNKEIHIPAFITKNVNKIGSGDIFTSSFSYYWMIKDLSIEQCAINASKSTAYYCDKKAYIDCSKISLFEYEEYKAKSLNKKQVYIAAPIFTLSELNIIDKVRTAFLSFGVKVFSPFHDVGLGSDISIASIDIQGIENSDIIFCLFDNLDSGTLIESGYSLAKGKKIIGYHRTCNENDLLMLKPGDIKLFNHLTTAIYQTIWNL